MEGIFGVGVAEVLIVALAIFVIGGPQNTAKWARQMGLFMRQLRKMWEEFMAELETEMGPEGKEVMDVARELGKSSRQVASMTPQKKMMGETMKLLESAIDVEENTKSVESVAPTNPEATAVDQAEAAPAEKEETKYRAWAPPEN